MKFLCILIGFFCAIQYGSCTHLSTKVGKRFYKAKLKCTKAESSCKIYGLYSDANDFKLIARKLRFHSFNTLEFIDSFLIDFPNDIFSNTESVYYLKIANLGLNHLELKDLEKFPNLEALYASHNSLESLPQNIFDATPNIRILNFAHNRLSQIDMGSIMALKQLHFLDLRGNICVDEKFDFSDDRQVARASHEIIQSCFPQNYKLQMGKRRCFLALALAAGMSGGGGGGKKRSKKCQKKCRKGKCKYRNCKKITP